MGKNQIRDGIKAAHRDPTWREGSDRVPGGTRGRQGGGGDLLREAARPGSNTRGGATYADFRELLDKERDVTAVKVMTPDHTHAPISIAALKKGMNVIVHKPLANRLLEARAVIEAARSGKNRHPFHAGQRGRRAESRPWT